MAAITGTSMTGPNAREVTITTLGASDTLTYTAGSILILNNVTGGALTPNIDGAGGTTVSVAGIGNVDVSSGYTTPSIGAGEYWAVPLNAISKYLQGAITVTGGSGIEAAILTF